MAPFQDYKTNKTINLPPPLQLTKVRLRKERPGQVLSTLPEKRAIQINCIVKNADNHFNSIQKKSLYYQGYVKRNLQISSNQILQISSNQIFQISSNQIRQISSNQILQISSNQILQISSNQMRQIYIPIRSNL